MSALVSSTKSSETRRTTSAAPRGIIWAFYRPSGVAKPQTTLASLVIPSIDHCVNYFRVCCGYRRNSTPGLLSNRLWDSVPCRLKMEWILSHTKVINQAIKRSDRLHWMFFVVWPIFDDLFTPWGERCLWGVFSFWGGYMFLEWQHPSLRLSFSFELPHLLPYPFQQDVGSSHPSTHLKTYSHWVQTHVIVKALLHQYSGLCSSWRSYSPLRVPPSTFLQVTSIKKLRVYINWHHTFPYLSWAVPVDPRFLSPSAPSIYPTP